jgi:hypothetical protein
MSVPRPNTSLIHRPSPRVKAAMRHTKTVPAAFRLLNAELPDGMVSRFGCPVWSMDVI